MTRHIVGGAAGGLMLNIVNQAFLLGITMVLTRIMSPSDYGLYAVILSVMLLLALPFSGGFPIFLMRHIGAAIAKDRYDLFRGLIQKTFIWIVGAGITLILLTYFALPHIVGAQAYYYRIGLGLVILPPLLLFFDTLLRAMRRVVLGRFPEFFIQPAILFSLLAFLMISGVAAMPVQAVLGFHIASYAIALSAGLLILYFCLPDKLKTAQPAYDTKEWIKSALPLMLAVGLVVVNSNIDIVMVGALAGDTEAGQYRVATRMAGFVLFFLFASNNAVGAIVSTKHVKGEHGELQTLLTAVARAMMLGTLPIALILWIWPQEILTLFFGSAFAAGASALVILSAANFFSVSMGQVGHVMSMTGQERYTAYAALMAMVVNIALNYLLIPHYGLTGAAIATGSSTIFWNALLAYWTAKKTGYHCSILGVIGK
ncbi:MAG TPA: polysaccharide biosynthesis C-terminal domain-containing protein [Alphaproteobacteria bacterium]|nr:polysaccharide biosynthesis C-terminal domain-containing protein [Alphaproteobacteria bacterium]